MSNWKTIGINQIDEKIFIFSNRKTNRTVPILGTTIIKLTISDSFESIGTAVLKCIVKWEENVPHPNKEEFKTINEPLVKLSGEKNKKEYFEKIKSVSVKIVGDKLSYFPMINKGWKKGFINTEYKQIVIENYLSVNTKKIGELTIQALNESKVD